MSSSTRPGNGRPSHAAEAGSKRLVAAKDPERDGTGNDTASYASARGDRVASTSRSGGVASRGAGSGRSGRPGWLVALAALVGLLLVAVFGLLAFRLARIFTAKRAAQGVAIAQRRSGETPAIEPPPTLTSRRRSPESWMPAVPTPLPDAGAAGAGDATSLRSPESDPLPLFPAGRFLVEESSTPPPRRVPNHLFVDTQPHGASVWVDGVLKGKTPLDLLAGAGGTRLALVAAGYHVFRDSFDAREGAMIRLALVPVLGPMRGDAFLNVVCRTEGKYPVLIDEVETGLLCPASRVPVAAGTHRVAVFVPGERKLVAMDIAAPAGPKPVEVNFAR